MMTHALASTTLTLTCSPNVSGHFTHCWVSLCTSCRQFNCCRCTKFVQFLTCTRIPCRDSHCENGSSEVLCFHPRQLQQTAVSCKRSNCNKIENNKKIVKVARLRYYPKTANNEFPHSIMSLCMYPHLSTFLGITSLPPTGGRTR